MIDITSTKTEIIKEILALANYLKKNKLFNLTRSKSSLSLDSKQNLIDLHRRMLDVISGDICKRGLSSTDPIPELKELNDEYNTKFNELRNQGIAKRDKYQSAIEKLIHEWLGNDIILCVSESCIDLKTSKDSKISISINYRESWNENKNPGKGHLEVNHPCWGSWNPKDPENRDAIRFFQVMNEIVSDPDWQHMDTICDCMDKMYQNSIQWYRDHDKLEKECHDKGIKIAERIVIDHYDKYIS